MGKILHIYEIDQETTDEFVDKNFKQRFVHVHFDDGSTILLRMLDFEGHKLDTITDEEKIVEYMKKVEEDIPENEREKIGRFLQGENDE